MSGMVITFATEKGGSKKTTQNQIIAEIFAGDGYSVNILDFDPQKTISKWIDRRNSLISNGIDIPKINLSQEFNKENFYNKIKESRDQFEITILDTPGSDSEALREAYIEADLIIIPVTAVQNDLETLSSIKQLLLRTQQRLHPEAIVRTMFVDLPTHANDKSKSIATKYLNDIGLLEVAPLLNATTKRRKIYSEAQADGITAFTASHEKANFECEMLKKEIFKILSDGE